MHKIVSAISSLLIFVGTCCIGVNALRAEVGVTHDRQQPYMTMITDDPEPILGFWDRHTDISRNDRHVLNFGGTQNGDGRPEVLLHPVTRLPFVVWARLNVEGFDIVLSRFEDGGWQPLETIAGELRDERDPRVVFSEDGRVHLVYWVGAESEGVVYYRSAPPGMGSWSAPERVSASGSAAQRPSIATQQGVIKVVFETVSGEVANPGAKDIALARRSDLDGFVIEWVASTINTGALWSGVHVRGGDLWIEWLDQETTPWQGEMGWLRILSDGSWSSVRREPYGSEEERYFHVRGLIRQKALASTEPSTTP